MSAESPERMVWRHAAKEARNFALPKGWQNERDIVQGITIDDASTRDRDDAIWFTPNDEGGHDVQVSIADVGTFIGPDTAMARYAALLGETRYLKSRPQPMFPREVGERALSLLDGKLSPTLTIGIRLDENCDIVDTELSKRAIQPLRKTYEEVAEHTHGEPGEVWTDIFRAYETMALRLLKNRQQQGAFAFYRPDQGAMTDEEGNIGTFHEGIEHSGQLIVQEFMLLGNTALSAYMRHHDIPGLFRQHRMAQPIDVAQAVALIGEGRQDHIQVIRSGMGKAWYTPEPGPHEALGQEVYAQGTSPLRRFGDLVNHWNTLAHKEGREIPFDHEALEQIAIHLNAVRDEIRGPKQYFKEKSQVVAHRRLERSTAEQLGQLPPGEFHRVVKAAAESGILSNAFGASIENKIHTDTLKTEDIVTLLSAQHTEKEWVDLKTSLLRLLQSQPHVATRALHVANSQGIFDGIRELEAEGEVGFTCTTTVTIGEITITRDGSATRKVDAHHAASLGVLSAYADIELQPVETSAELTQANTANPKGALNEYTQIKGIPQPIYDTRSIWTDGTEHVFASTVSVEGSTYDGHGRTKKEAERMAALAAVSDKGIGGSASGTSKSEQWSNAQSPISALQERSQQNGLPEPVYHFEQSGPPHKPVFRCTITFYLETGSQTVTEQATSKAAAKNAAAQSAIRLLASRIS